MISTRLYLDTRASGDGPAPVKVQITRRGKTALLPTGVRVTPDQWDRANLRIVRHPQKTTLNAWLQKYLFEVQDVIRAMQLGGAAADMSVTEIKNAVAEHFDGRSGRHPFYDFTAALAATKTPSTRRIWDGVLRVLERFDPGIRSRDWRDLDPAWVARLDAWLGDNYSPGSRRQFISVLKASAHAALSDGSLSRDPFASLDVPRVATRKRCLTREQLRTLWAYVPRTRREAEALDFFKFSFLTIAANPVDLCALTPASVQNGRIEYDRSKTGHHFSVRVVDELRPILARYSDASRLWSPLARMGGYRSLVASYDHTLNRLSRDVLGLPTVSLYWARHTWATMAAELDIPVEVISSALGHSHGAPVTLVYIALDQRKVDDAHRRVLDYALGEGEGAERIPAPHAQTKPTPHEKNSSSRQI